MRTASTPMIAFMLVAGSWLAPAQQANINLDYNPQKNTENLIPFGATLNSPDVRDDRTVTFRVKAPEAHTVTLSGPVLVALDSQDKPVPFAKGADGVWALTVGPLKPDMYIYYFVIDGIRMADPNNSIAGFTAMPPYGQLVVQGDGPAYYDARKVPHGNVTRHVYHSDVTDGERELYGFINRAYRELIGTTYEETEGHKWQMALHPEDSTEYLGAFQCAVREHTRFRAEARARRSRDEPRTKINYPPVNCAAFANTEFKAATGGSSRDCYRSAVAHCGAGHPGRKISHLLKETKWPSVALSGVCS